MWKRLKDIRGTERTEKEDLWKSDGKDSGFPLTLSIISRKILPNSLKNRCTVLNREKGVFEPPSLRIHLHSIGATAAYHHHHKIVASSSPSAPNNIDGPSGRGSMSSPIRKTEKRKGTIASSISRLPYQSNTQ
uniref:Ovule protein n=1 Tax=Elaeophora elaphi TaxID=1147741 RepID=A0A0R3RJ48_9BILA